MLTGYADPSAIIKAINEGQIHRYISKPWNDEEMLLILRQALDHQHLARERERLEQLTRVQNDQLKLLNSTLEKHVSARTAELQQTADMLDLAYEELKHSYVTGTEVFSLLANLRLPPAKQTNRQIIELVRAYCRVHQLDEAASRDLAMAAALYNIGKMSWTDETERLAVDDPGPDERCGAVDPASSGALGRQRVSRSPQGRGHSLRLATVETGGGFRRVATWADSRTADEQR